jgi:hypothetical protein
MAASPSATEPHADASVRIGSVVVIKIITKLHPARSSIETAPIVVIRIIILQKVNENEERGMKVPPSLDSEAKRSGGGVLWDIEPRKSLDEGIKMECFSVCLSGLAP